MKNKYNEYLENIKVTDEMRDRILNNINETEFDEQPKKIIRFFTNKTYLLAAACAAILIIGAVMIPHLLKKDDGPSVGVIPDITEYNSAEELSNAVGFEVKEFTDLPFVPDNVIYTKYGKVAEILYTDDDESLRFRKIDVSEDPSGDYNEYGEVKEIMQQNHLITIKGNDGMFYLAVWEDNGYTYSLQIQAGIDEKEILNIISETL